MLESLELSASIFILVAIVSFLTAILHGATGMAGGIIMSMFLSHLIGVKLAIPVTTCALVFSHSSRVFLYRRHADWRVALRVLIFAAPSIAIGAIVFTRLQPETIALMMAFFLSVSFPIKHYAKRYKLSVTDSVLAGASSAWGFLAGNVIGPGFLLAPFLLGTGMSRLTFVGTLATITLAMNIIKLFVFGANDLFLDTDLLLLGVIIGLISFPGNWLGRSILKRISDQDHHRLVDVLTVFIILNFVYLSLYDGWLLQ